jgi:hypothetical protein
MGELHIKYVKDRRLQHTLAKNACKSTNMLQLLKFSFCFYQIFHEYRTYHSYKSYVFCFWNCYLNYVTNLAPKNRNKLLVILFNPFSRADQGCGTTGAAGASAPLAFCIFNFVGAVRVQTMGVTGAQKLYNRQN